MPRFFTQKRALGTLSAAVLGTIASMAHGMVINPYHRSWQCSASGGKWVCHQTQNPDSDLYKPNTSSSQHDAVLAKSLGWIPDTSDNPQNCSVCGGHYYEPPVPVGIKSIAQSSTHVEPGHTSYAVHGALNLTDGVVVTQPGRWLYANTAVITPDEKTGKLRRLSATGNIRLRQPGQLLLAKHLDANLVNHEANLKNAYYLMQVSPEAGPGNHTYYDPNFTGYAHGYAVSGKQLNMNQYILHNATYTTCPPGHHTWNLGASTIKLDRKSGRGVAYNTVLYVHGVPVFYTPYLNFPINSKRKTGFLYGSASYSRGNGAEIYVPFYLNLAPNYDDLIAADYFSNRGVLWRNQFRFLTPSSKGFINGDYIYKDKVTNQSRYRYQLQDTTNLSENLVFSGIYNKVSDKDFLGDFSQQNNAIASNTVLLDRKASLSYASPHWSLGGLVSSYQIVNPELSTSNRPYERLPQLTAAGQYPYILSPFSFGVTSSYSNFRKSSANSDNQPVEGQRFTLQPTLSLPLQRPYGFFTPAITLNMAQYQLNHYQNNGFNDQYVHRNIPTFDIDTGLFFNRNFTFNNEQYTQTLEPRLFYLYTPYRSQSNVPIFDTGISTFDFGQLFSTNRFSGQDRIGDANRLGMALSTTINDAQGDQIIDAGIGQAFYFSTRRVSVCNQNDNAECIASENPDYQQHASDLLGQAKFTLWDNWNVTTQAHYSYHRHQVDYEQYGLQYQQDPRHLFNINYESNKFDYGLLSNQDILNGVNPPRLTQINTSFLWKLTPHWSVVGSWDYSITNNGTISQFGGFQYDSCCWATRFLVFRYIQNSNPNVPQQLSGPLDVTYMIQFELKGLGSTGGAQLNNLVANIPGYNRMYSGFH